MLDTVVLFDSDILWYVLTFLRWFWASADDRFRDFLECVKPNNRLSVSNLGVMNLGIPWYMGCCKWSPNWIDEYTESTKAPSCKLTSMWETDHLQIIFLRFRHGCSTSKYGSSVHEFVQRFNSAYLGTPDFQTKPSILIHYIKLILSPIISRYISHYAPLYPHYILIISSWYAYDSPKVFPMLYSHCIIYTWSIHINIYN